ncbi:MAG: chorismate synthase [Saprospiraceae bacterium]|nr:chorismate synthase [Saprospiraceae bacterium]
MNQFGRFFRITIYGESHGPEVGIVIDGCPPGIAIHEEDFLSDLKRRKPGVKGTTPRIEDDIPVFSSGIFNGFSTGSPININFINSNTRSETYTKQRDIPRPGHADFTGHIKFKGFEDYRGGGHFSGRLTVALVAAGVIAKKVINHHLKSKVHFQSEIVEIAGCPDIQEGIQRAIEAKDSVGGIVQCTIKGLPVGLGESFFDSVESVISHIAFSIPAVKGIEFGAGFKAARMFGSEHNDAIINPDGLTLTNHSGGINGGISNGNDIVFRVVVKPTSSTPKEQHSWNMASGEMESFSYKGRHDLCIALRVPVILEAVAAIALADLALLTNR